MEYPKKITRNYTNGEQPAIIIRCSGEFGMAKVVEYALARTIGNMFIYKKI